MLMGVRAKALLKSQIPDPTNERVVIAPTRSWLVLLAVGLMCAGTIIWGTMSTLVSSVSTERAFLLVEPVPFEVASTVAGAVTYVADAGAVVSRGTPLVKIESGGTSTTLTSPRDGYVVGQDCVVGSFVRPGDTVARVGESQRTQPVFHAYFSMDQAATIDVGMPVEMALQGFPPGSFGYVSGAVRSVDTHPVSSAQVGRLLQNADATRALLGDQQLVDVVVAPDADGADMKWVRGEGPGDVRLYNGMSASAQVILGAYHPLDAIVGRVR